MANRAAQVMFILFLLFLLPAVYGYNLLTNITAYYPAGATYSSGNIGIDISGHNNATLTNVSNISDAVCNSGECWNLSATSNITIPDNVLNLTAGTQNTICYMVYLRENDINIFRFAQDGNNELRAYKSSSIYYWQYYHTGKYQFQFNASGNVNESEWVSICHMLTDNNASLWINGLQLRTNITSTMAGFAYTQNNNFGGSYYTPQTPNYRIKDIGFWNRVLNYSEVAQWDTSVRINNITYPFNLSVGDTIAPLSSVNITYPTANNSNYTIMINISYTAFDINLDSVWWSRDNGITNNTGLNYSTCYQESANQTNQSGTDGKCGQQYTGAYVFAGDTWADTNYSIFDGDWTTYSYGGINSQLYINYSKPANLKAAMWMIATGYNNENISIPSSCLSQSKIQLKINTSSTIQYSNYSCWNGTGWQGLYQTALGTYGFNLYEEAILWSINNVSAIISGQTWDEGSNIVQVCANDTSGNTNCTSRQFNIDTAVPLVSIISPINKSYFSISNLNYSRFDVNLDSCWYNFAGSNYTLTGCNNATGLTWNAGSNTIILYVNDTAGNTASDNVTFSIINASVSYGGVINFASVNLTNILQVNVTTACPTDRAGSNISMLINGAVNETRALTCDNSIQTYIFRYIHPSQALYSINFSMTSIIPSESFGFGARNFYEINTAPVIAGNFTSNASFASSNSTNVSVSCTDAYFNNSNLTKYFNSVLLYNGSVANHTNQSNMTGVINGNNILTATCSNLFLSSSLSISRPVYLSSIVLIDEKTNSVFNLSDGNSSPSSVIVYLDDNRTSWDFHSNNISYLNFTTDSIFKLRFQFGYGNETYINRYVDVSLGADNLRVCINKNGILHYEQIIQSHNSKALVLKNVYSDCLIAQDYTRFSYQDGQYLKAYTINSLYYLYTYDSSGNKIYLASMDGSLQTYYNLDTLQFQNRSYNVNPVAEGLTFKKTSNTTLLIYYLNQRNDSVSTRIKVINQNTSLTYLDVTETAQPNEMTLYFDWSTIPNIPNASVWKIELTKIDTTGKSTTTQTYFNKAGSSGWLSAPVAFVISLMLVIFGLTFTIPRLTFGYFGIIAMLCAIVVLTLCIMTWYIKLLLGMEVIMFIYVIIMSMAVYQKTGAVT